MDIEEEILSIVKNEIQAVLPSVRDGVDGKDGERGEKGEKGDKGDKGDRGEPGKDGKNGRDGKDGTDGRDGIDGKDGVDGKDGKDVDEETLARLEEKIEKVSKVANTPRPGGVLGIKRLVAGTGISIDDSSLEYPIITATGGADVILQSPNGTNWVLGITNNGELTATSL